MESPGFSETCVQALMQDENDRLVHSKVVGWLNDQLNRKQPENNNQQCQTQDGNSLDVNGNVLGLESLQEPNDVSPELQNPDATMDEVPCTRIDNTGSFVCPRSHENPQTSPHAPEMANDLQNRNLEGLGFVTMATTVNSSENAFLQGLAPISTPRAGTPATVVSASSKQAIMSPWSPTEEQAMQGQETVSPKTSSVLSYLVLGEPLKASSPLTEKSSLKHDQL